jgi:hypothetical protein
MTWRNEWSNQMAALARKLAADRKTAAAIAEEISKRFRPVTRNGVIGFCDRNHIVLHGQRGGGRPSRATAEQIALMRAMTARGEPRRVIAAAIGFSTAGIQHLCARHGIKTRGKPGPKPRSAA